MAIVDVHSHFVPEGLPDMSDLQADPRWPVMRLGPEPEIVSSGRRYRAIDASYFDIDERVRLLDQLEIDVQVLSPLPVMLPFWADPEPAALFCEAYNEQLAATVAAHPSRFLGLGVIPLQDPGRALDEIARVRALGLAGLEFGTWLGSGRELSDEPRRELFSAAAEAGLPVLLHPNHPDTFGCGTSPVVELGVGIGCETARAMAQLHLAGTLDEQPGLRICLSHGGGAFLWLWPRFRAVAERAGRSSELPSCLYVDTAGVGRANLSYLDGLLDEDRLLLGTDLPATGASRVGALIDEWTRDRVRTLGASTEVFLCAS